MDYKNLPGAPFIIEYGAQALPDISALARQFDPSELNYSEGEVRSRWEFQDFQPIAAFNVAGISLKTSTGDAASPRTFVRNSQDYQANLLQFATEAYRRAKYSPIGGIFQYMFVDEWPSITYSVLDDQRTPKEGYAALQTAMQPVLPSILPVMPDYLMGRTWVYKSSDSLRMVLWIVNDTLENYPSARLKYEVVGLDGQQMQVENFTLNIESDEANAGYLISNLALKKGEYQLKVTLQDSQGVELGHNEFLFAIIPPEEAPAK
jgi:beta-mannosidase